MQLFRDTSFSLPSVNYSKEIKHGPELTSKNQNFILQGYKFSVYTRIVCLVLHSKKATFQYQECNPFENQSDCLHPFQRVPCLSHNGHVIFETNAITRYLDRVLPNPLLQPNSPFEMAKMEQIISIIDQYAYWPMIREVFEHLVFRPKEGLVGDEAVIRDGLVKSHKILNVFEYMAGHAPVLDAQNFTLADLHLAPILDYLQRAPEGRDALSCYPRLSRWFDHIAQTEMMQETDPEF